ncbi:MAG: hypothetical protein HY584_01120 [Candidatus Omnitrophica bacterium]|nr:hypothetical protein [Candidatus Omnitrophota bacterium]
MPFPESFGRLLGNFGDLVQLAKDENFRKFLSHPKVQSLMNDPEFKRAVEEKNVFKLMANPEFRELVEDPEVRSALEGMRAKYEKSE